MRIVSFPGGFGRLDGEHVVPLGDDLRTYLAGAEPGSGQAAPPDPDTLLAPVPDPSKIVCVGLNYYDHAKEAGKEIPEEPLLFGKFANSVTAHRAQVALPRCAEKVDFEGELGVVIGRSATRVDPDHAVAHIAGYTVLNDLSARDLQWRQGQWTRGKAIDGFLPMGPALVTADAIPDPHDLAVRTRLNGELMQDSSTSQLIFGVGELVSHISETITLEPGDIIATGTPPGVGAFRDPPRFLAPGDVVEVEIAGLGTLVTHMVPPDGAS